MVSHPGADTSVVRRSQELIRSCTMFPDAPLVRAEQIHGGDVAWVLPEDDAVEPERLVSVVGAVDGLLTQTSRLTLMAYSADCPIVFLFSPRKGGVAGLLHASWRGISKGIPRTGVREISRQTEIDPVDLRAYISPSIRVCCYEVQSDFRAEMLDSAPETEPCFVSRHNHLYFDLQQAITRQLRRSGLPGEQITDARICSFCRSDLLYSYRRNDVRTGRTAGLISLGKPGSFSAS